MLQLRELLSRQIGRMNRSETPQWAQRAPQPFGILSSYKEPTACLLIRGPQDSPFKRIGKIVEMNKTSRPPIENFRVPAPVQLSLLWTSLMSLYIYNDYLVMFVPGTIEEMSAGSMGPLGEASDFMMLVVAVIMAIPASMVFLSSILPASASRLSNLIVGPIYCVIAVLTLFGSPLFYQFIVVIEIIATLLIVWIAMRWPRQNN